MTHIIQRASRRVAEPWRNGMGVQYEIAADGPLPDGWTWRLSVAEISHDVSFSDFTGVCREFCVAIGNGVVLTIDGAPIRCDPGSITTFDGGATVAASPVDGPTSDVNLMVRHGSPPKHLSVHRSNERVNGVEALVAIVGSAGVRVDGEILELEVLDALLHLGRSEILITHGVVAVVR